jgi:hypothetical protein
MPGLRAGFRLHLPESLCYLYSDLHHIKTFSNFFSRELTIDRFVTPIFQSMSYTSY